MADAGPIKLGQLTRVLIWQAIRTTILLLFARGSVPVLARIAAKREKGYKALGYVLES
jgi:hypothetical protein